MTMEPYQQRVHDEHAELCVRLGKLRDFLNSERSNELPIAELKRMRRQATYMELYAEVLSDRMEAWSSVPEPQSQN